jgi:antitoxin component of MazEF toxin-antitoxin module
MVPLAYMAVAQFPQIATVYKRGHSCAIRISPAFLKKIGWEAGDKLSIAVIDDNHIIMRRLKLEELAAIYPDLTKYGQIPTVE